MRTTGLAGEVVVLARQHVPVQPEANFHKSPDEPKNPNFNWEDTAKTLL
jgi:hypothetical protein